jgi:23S rRNA (adenine1618-N6)-methyltransferase
MFSICRLCLSKYSNGGRIVSIFECSNREPFEIAYFHSMLQPYKQPLTEKPILHPRNPHRERYDFKLLTDTCPALTAFIIRTPYGEDSIDFANPAAVKMLNFALLKQYYGIEYWDVPPGYLCPPIPGRADYIHYMADLLADCNSGKIPKGQKIKCLDVGVGANCIYPIIGSRAYGWSFVGTDIDPVSIESANKIIAASPFLQERVSCRLQANPKDVFTGILRTDEYFDLSICNPPFHHSAEAAAAGALRKLNNLNHRKVTTPSLNFGGHHSEIWCEGGEVGFIENMVRQSRQFATTCCWYSTIVSREDHLKPVYQALDKVGAGAVRTIPMGQGNKISRVVAWSFLSAAQMGAWRKARWG